MLENQSSESSRQFAVVDVETTGVYKSDRIIEIAVVVLDENLEVIDEYDTLVDPMRDIGPVHIHGIKPSMLSNAPSFEDVAAAVRMRVHGRVAVAHNLSFDQRFLQSEYGRLHADLIPGRGVCTLRQTGEKLKTACRTYGVTLESHHRALADARATADLLRKIFDEEPQVESVRIENLTYPMNPRTLRREIQSEGDLPLLGRLIAATRYPTSDGILLSYLDALDWVLDDCVITNEEQLHLEELASELGLSDHDVADANRRYLASMIQAAWRDGIITEQENHLIAKVADLLKVRDFSIPDVTEKCTKPASFKPGTRVCFTGTATDDQGNQITRPDLETFAANAGLQPVSSVTKSKCDLLVAADPTSNSGKAGKARKYDIPILSVDEFLREVRTL